MNRDSLFQSNVVPGKPGSGRLFDEELTVPDGPDTCIGITFANDAQRRAFFTEKLREKLNNPEYRKIEGFPIGSDEDILALSNPPYYTACPNPWLADFVAEWEAAKPDANTPYHREPFATDVSEGKTHAVYKAHGYHTKVPHLAIVPSILHYTEPGDIILDGFSGSGQTGVAAQWCGAAPTSYRTELEKKWKSESRHPPKWGTRHCVLNDLSPTATFISSNYNQPFDAKVFASAARKLLTDIEQELGWMYETLHNDGKSKGRIEYTVWSEVFTCPNCAGEVNFINEALDGHSKRVREEFSCPHCDVKLTKKKLERLYVTQPDSATGKMLSVPKREPTLISYKLGKTRYEKKLDADDLALLRKIEALRLPPEVPTVAFPFADMWEAPRMRDKGISHTHHLFFPRAAQALGALWRRAKAYPDVRTRHMLVFTVEQAIWGLSILARYAPTHFSQVNQYLAGAYYIGSQIVECSPWYVLQGKINRLPKAFELNYAREAGTVIATCSTTAHLSLQDESIDYIFTDPPFGENFPYAELNFLVEAWYGVITEARLDAIVDRSKENRAAQKSIADYRRLMVACFSEYYRVLKPGRWMTVVFSNSQASVWNSLQSALQQAGFVVANISALDKKQGSFKAVTTSVAVKQDLVISAYKPNGGFEQRFLKEAQTEDGVWDLLRTHLKYLPSVKVQGKELGFIPERDPRILFDQVVAYYFRHDYAVPISSQEFQVGLAQRFIERDGMYFLPEQAVEYDRAQMLYGNSGELLDTSVVGDEHSAIVWLGARLKRAPQVYSDIQPSFMPMLSHLKPNERELLSLELLLNQNFLCYDGNGPVPEQIHAYLSSNWKEMRNLSKENRSLRAKARDRWYVPDPNKAGDLEKLREKALLKEFEAYKQQKKKLKVFRLEAVRAGFKKAWADRDYATIVDIADKIPVRILEEDPILLRFHDWSSTRMGADT